MDPNLGLLLCTFFLFLIAGGGFVDLGFILVLVFLNLVLYCAWFGVGVGIVLVME